MSIKKFLVAAAVIAGSSSAALAHPYRQDSYRREAYRREAYRHDTYRSPWMARRYFAQPRVSVYRPYRYYAAPTYVAPMYVAPSYVEPTYIAPQAYAPTSYFNNGQLDIALGGAPREIQVQMTDGPAYIAQIAIHYADGRTQIIRTDAQLDAAHPIYNLRAEGYAITGVTLFGEGGGLNVVGVP